jgi:hypothetical protein
MKFSQVLKMREAELHTGLKAAQPRIRNIGWRDRLARPILPGEAA